jgi:hypothetical protein
MGVQVNLYASGALVVLILVVGIMLLRFARPEPPPTARRPLGSSLARRTTPKER